MTKSNANHAVLKRLYPYHNFKRWLELKIAKTEI